MKKIHFSIILFLNFALLSYIGFTEWQRSTTQIAYVRSHDLVYEFSGMKEAKRKFDLKKEGYLANIDTLRLDYEKALEGYQTNLSNLSAQEKKAQSLMLQRQKESIYKYSENLNKVIEEEENKMLQGVLNQVNNYAHKYAKKNGYKLVLGTTLSGSILYGEPAIDITKPLLEIMNYDYVN